MSKNIENMYKAINLDSDIFCGHEYAIQNLSWGMAVENTNQTLINLHSEFTKQKDEKG